VRSLVTDRIRKMPFSGIRKFFDVAKEIEGALSLGVGEPDFDTPWAVRSEAIYHLENGKSAYTSNAGLLELRQAISKYMKDRFSLSYSPLSQVLVTVGASEGIDVALRALIDPGDEVLLVEPCFVSYKPCIMMAGGVCAIVSPKAENGFRLRPEDFLDKITSKTKALMMSYPSNPTGAIMEREDLEKVADVLRDLDICVISDEIYAELTYGTDHVSIASLPGMLEKTVVISGFSKSCAMTGWRLGYACGPQDIIEAMLKIHQYVLMCAPAISQYAGVEALKSAGPSIISMRRDYDGRRRVVVNGFREMGLDCFEPKGAFYVFPSIKSTGLSSEEFCMRLLYEQKVAAVPGNAFGECGEGYIRCSYASSIDCLKEALCRIGKFLETLKS
jgi:aminotransferase